MQATATAMTLIGLEGHKVSVEVDSGRGPAQFHLVGLAEASVRESRVRVRAALQQLNVDVNEYVLTVNLAPADLRKQGGGFDLAIAMAILAALGRVDPLALDNVLLIGELALSGAVRPVRGVLPLLRSARAQGIKRAVVPEGNGSEAAHVRGVTTWACGSLKELLVHLRGESPLPLAKVCAAPAAREAAVDMSEVRGQFAARRAIEIAAAGAHNLLMVGPPGSGKTLLARRVPTILPPLLDAEALELTAIHSVAGLVPADSGLVRERPFRAPHHTVSPAALVGGGDPVRPGDISLAHLGCLFLDEVLEFRRATLDALRQPLEDGTVAVSRVRSRVLFPARPMVVAAANPCPCGYLGSDRRPCVCRRDQVAAYRNRLSGPVLDRIDIQLELAAINLKDLAPGRASGETSEAMRERVIAARQRQQERLKRGEVSVSVNAALSVDELLRVNKLDAAAVDLLERAMDRFGLSARAYTKVLRIARTIADLAGTEAASRGHIAEAIGLRVPETRVLDAEPPQISPTSVVGA